MKRGDVQGGGTLWEAVEEITQLCVGGEHALADSGNNVEVHVVGGKVLGDIALELGEGGGVPLVEATVAARPVAHRMLAGIEGNNDVV